MMIASRLSPLARMSALGFSRFAYGTASLYRCHVNAKKIIHKLELIDASDKKVKLSISAARETWCR